MKRAAIFLRVSTDAQTTDNQRAAVMRLAESRGYVVDPRHVYVEEGVSGIAARRPTLDALRQAISRREVDAVCVWALDRLGRNTERMVSFVKDADAWGVAVWSVSEPWLDTTGPVRELLLYIFGWVASQERTRLVERTRAGLARAKSQGIKLGRPKGTKDKAPRLRRFRTKPKGL